MATQPKVNPVLPNEARHFNGKSVTAVTVTLGVATTGDGEFGPNGVIQAVYEVLSENATPIIIGQVRDTGATSNFDVYFEGDFTEVDDYGSSSNLSFIADLEDRIQALGTTAGLNDLDLENNAAVAAISDLEAREAGNVGLVGDGGFEI